MEFDLALFEKNKEKNSKPLYYEDIVEKVLLENKFEINDFQDTDIFHQCHQLLNIKFGDVNENYLLYTLEKISLCLQIIKNSDLNSKVIELQKIPQPDQRTPEWYKYREKRITASSWGNALGYSPEKEKGIKKYLLDKLGYEPVQFKGNIMTEWGTKYEPVATSIYERRTQTKVIEFGCLPHGNPDYYFIGASPDGIMADGVMLEIKCPFRRKISGIPPVYYWMQMQGQLEVCDLEKCDFLECELKEYVDEEEYFHDLGEDGTISSGMESGFVIEFKGEDKKYYEYSSFFMTGEEEKKFTKEMIEKHQKEGHYFDRKKYWKIEKYSVIPVYRDRKWFEVFLPKLKDFFDLWMSYQENGFDDLIKEYESKKPAADRKLSSYNGFTKKSILDSNPFKKKTNEKSALDNNPFKKKIPEDEISVLDSNPFKKKTNEKKTSDNNIVKKNKIPEDEISVLDTNPFKKKTDYVFSNFEKISLD